MSEVIGNGLWRVTVIESERGWGQKVDEYRRFKTEKKLKIGQIISINKMICQMFLIGICMPRELGMSHKIAIIEEYNRGLPVGSILQEAVIVRDFEGNEYWEGMHSSMAGSYLETIPLKYGEIWDEQIHDPLSFYIKQDFSEKKAKCEEAEERATLARLKLKYEGV